MAFLPWNNLESLEIGATAWPNILNANTVNIDEGLIRRGTLASRPAFGTANRLYYSTDTNELFYDTGSAWVLVADGGATPPLPVLLSATGVVGITSATYVVVPTMTHTLVAAGNYLITFSSYGYNSSIANLDEYGIFVNAVLQGYTHRDRGGASGTTRNALHSQLLLSGAAGTETIDVRAKTNSGTFNIGDRSLIVQKVG